MQLQGDISIFCGIFARLFDGHLVKTDLLGTFAVNGFEGNRVDAKMAFAEFIHAVAFMALEHIRLEQGIVGDAL